MNRIVVATLLAVIAAGVSWLATGAIPFALLMWAIAMVVLVTTSKRPTAGWRSIALALLPILVVGALAYVGGHPCFLGHGPACPA